MFNRLQERMKRATMNEIEDYTHTHTHTYTHRDPKKEKRKREGDTEKGRE